MSRSVSILAFSDRGGRGGGLGGFLLPALLLAGGGVVTWYFVFGPGKGQIIGTGTGISNYFNGLYNTARDYAIYLLVGGILLQLIYAKVLRGTGTVGGFFALTSWIMMIVGGLLTLTNFSGVIAKIPGIGANIRQLTGSNYSALPPMGGKSYRPVQRRIITGTSQTTQTNPSYDKNTVFPVIGDVY